MKPQFITPDRCTQDSLDNLLRTTTSEYAAAYCDQRARFIEAENKRNFVELGIITLFVDENELWKRLADPDGNEYHSCESWIVNACPSSRSHAFAAKAAVKIFRENHLPQEVIEKIPHKNIRHLKGLSTQVMCEPEILKAAETLPELEFVQTVQRRFPDQLIEARVPLRLNPTCSQRAIYDRAFIRASVVYETTDREELLEFILQDWLESAEEESPENQQAMGAQA